MDNNNTLDQFVEMLRAEMRKELASQGGKAAAASMTPEERLERSRKANEVKKLKALERRIQALEKDRQPEVVAKAV